MHIQYIYIHVSNARQHKIAISNKIFIINNDIIYKEAIYNKICPS